MKKSLKHFYEEDKTLSPLELSKKAGVSINYVKTFLKRHDEDKQILSKQKIKKHFVPAGSGLFDHYQADVMFMHDYKFQNRRYLAVLTCLNTTTREAWAQPLKSTSEKDVIPAIKKIIADIRTSDRIDFLRTDGGPEFTNKVFKDLLQKEDIIPEQAEAHVSSWLNRTNSFHRTLRYMFAELFARNKNNKWVDHLQSIIQEYNETPSRAFEPSLKKATPPDEITEKDERKIHTYEREKMEKARAMNSKQLSDDDYVRLSVPFTKAGKKEHGKFVKPTMTQSWTKEVYQVKRKGPNTWYIYELDGSAPKNEIKIWHTYNLQKTNKPTNTGVGGQDPHNFTNVKVARAKRDEERNISHAEQKKAVKQAPLRRNRNTRATRVDYKKLAGK